MEGPRRDQGETKEGPRRDQGGTKERPRRDQGASFMSQQNMSASISEQYLALSF